MIDRLRSRLFRCDPPSPALSGTSLPTHRARVIRSELSRGFTLIEILVVVVLIGVLATAGYVGWQVQTQKARDGARKATLDEWSGALLSYQDEGLCFPEEVDMSCDSIFLDPYLDTIPCDPINDSEHKYRYVKESCNIFYIYTKLENEADEEIARIGCSGGCGPDGEKNYNYVVTSGNVTTGGSGFGIPPSCGSGDNLYCFPAVCGTCCPGSSYRCNLEGNGCILDVTCNL